MGESGVKGALDKKLLKSTGKEKTERGFGIDWGGQLRKSLLGCSGGEIGADFLSDKFPR